MDKEVSNRYCMILEKLSQEEDCEVHQLTNAKLVVDLTLGAGNLHA